MGRWNFGYQHLLGHDELHFLLDKMQTVQNKYQELKNICNYRAQAFLVLTGLTATAGIKALSPEEKTQRLALIKHHMGQSLTKEVVYVLTNRGDHDWENLEKDLRLLIDGNYEAAVSSLQVEEVIKELQSVFHKKKERHEPHDNENKKEEVIENGAFQDLLQRLGWVCLLLSRTQLFVIPWAIACLAPLYGIFWARILDWVAISSSRGSS